MAEKTKVTYRISLEAAKHIAKLAKEKQVSKDDLATLAILKLK